MNKFDSRGLFNGNFHWGYLMFHYDIANLVDDELYVPIIDKLELNTKRLEL
jgi:hypothetical protein